MSVIQVGSAGDADAMCDACMQISEGYEFEREVLEIQAIIAAIEDIDQAMLLRLKDLGSPRTGELHLQLPTPPANITYQSLFLLFFTTHNLQKLSMRAASSTQVDSLTCQLGWCQGLAHGIAPANEISLRHVTTYLAMLMSECNVLRQA